MSVLPNPAPCLALTTDQVESYPHPTLLGGRAWDCPRCGKTFSEANPTYGGGMMPYCDSYRERQKSGSQ